MPGSAHRATSSTTAGWIPAASRSRLVDTHQEGLRMPPVKLRRAAWCARTSCAGSATRCAIPLVALDVKGQIASLNSGRQRVLELFERWGADTVESAMEQSIIAFAREAGGAAGGIAGRRVA